MDGDKITTYSGMVAAIASAVVVSGYLNPDQTKAVGLVGAISSGVWAAYTNKPLPGESTSDDNK